MSARILVMKRKRKPHAVTGIGKNMCISDTFWRIMTNTICRENKQTNVLAFTNETQKAIVVQNSWKASANPNNFPIIYLLNLKTLWGLPREILKSKVDLRNNSPHTLCMILRVFCHPDYQFHYLEHFRHHCVSHKTCMNNGVSKVIKHVIFILQTSSTPSLYRGASARHQERTWIAIILCNNVTFILQTSSTLCLYGDMSQQGLSYRSDFGFLGRFLRRSAKSGK